MTQPRDQESQKYARDKPNDKSDHFTPPLNCAVLPIAKLVLIAGYPPRQPYRAMLPVEPPDPKENPYALKHETSFL
jgi:hypothetical protein